MAVRPGKAAALAAALILSAPAAASASRMSMYLLNGHVEFHYFADPGESNQLTVTSYAAGNAYCGRPNPYGPQTPGEACYFVKDPGAIGHINAGGSCMSLEAAYPGEAECFLGELGVRDDTAVHIDIKLADGNDTVSLGTAAAAALIFAGPGDDVIDARGAARVEVLGGEGNDTIAAHTASDVLQGDDGNDTFIEPCGAIPAPRGRIDGGPGLDTVSFACAAYGETVNLRTDPRLANLESVIGTPYNDVIYGVGRKGTLDGGLGNDVIHAGNEYDIVKGGEGDDTIYGGTGGQALEGGAGRDTIYGGPGDDLITDTGGNGKYFGRGGNDTIIAGGSLYGGPGNDRLICTGWTSGSADVSSGVITAESCLLSDGPGDDHVEGANTSGGPPFTGDGDFVIAGTGRDTYDLHGGPLAGTAFYCENEFNTCGRVTLRPDTISYAARTNPVHASLDGQANDGEAGEHDNIIAAGLIVGGSGDDVLVGSSTRATTLVGGQGDDTLRGGGRGDLLRGGPGDDRLLGGAGDDQLAGGPGIDTFKCGAGKDQVGDRRRGEVANGCEVFGPLPRYPRA